MKKSSFFIFLAFLFVVSCSNGDEPLIPCVTVSDCPDSSYSCFDGFCVHAGAVVDPADSDSDTSSGDTLPDGDKNDGGDTDTSDTGDNTDDGQNSELPDPVTVDDDDENLLDADNVEENDTDADSPANDEDNEQESDSDSETTDGNGSESDDDNENSDVENSGDGDSEISSDSDNDSDSDADTDVDNDADQDADQDVELPTESAACADAIAALPHGGKYDWDDGTTQGFSTNNYWNLVESSVLTARSGNYSFGKYSGYTENIDYTSALGPADLSACKECMVKATFYAKGKNYAYSCSNSNKSYIHPTCNGEGVTTATNGAAGPWNNSSTIPASPWVATKEDSGVEFLTYATGCRYSDQGWVDEYHNKPLMWTIPDTCMTDEFVFGLRFRSDSTTGKGLVVDDLTIYATTKNEPKGEFESAAGGKIKGWACDPDAYPEKVTVKVRYYKNKDESVVAAERSVDAESERTDLTQCDETYNHGFEIPFDAELATILGIGTHSAAVFIGDLPAECAGTYKLIGIKDFEITDLDPKHQ
ncbi:hypothetical protein J5681_08685 [bacterium]|nr:hypothetical protein [bacterium]